MLQIILLSKLLETIRNHIFLVVGFFSFYLFLDENSVEWSVRHCHPPHPTSIEKMKKKKKVAEIFREKFIIVNVVCDHLRKRTFMLNVSFGERE